MNSFHTGLYSLNSFPPGNATPCGAFCELCLFHPDFDRWLRIPTGSAACAGRGLPAIPVMKPGVQVTASKELHLP